MTNNVIKAVLIGCLFVSILAKAQNPFITKADIIAQFDISSDKQHLCCKWWGADAMAKIRVKDLGIQKVLDIDSISLKKAAALYFSDGVSFLSNDVILFGKDKMILSYDMKKRKLCKLFDLPDSFMQSFVATKDEKGVYLLSDKNIYYADIKDGIRNSIAINKDAFVTAISATVNNPVIYVVRRKEKGKSMHQIWSWNGRNQPTDLTNQFSKEIEVPYLVEATTSPDLYVVVNAKGVFRFDKSTQKATKLVDNHEDDSVINIRVSADNRTVYYLTYKNRAVIRTMDMDGKQGEAITM